MTAADNTTSTALYTAADLQDRVGQCSSSELQELGDEVRDLENRAALMPELLAALERVQKWTHSGAINGAVVGPMVEPAIAKAKGGKSQ